MSSKKHTPEQIINKLRQSKNRRTLPKAVSQAARKIGITDQTYYRWRTEYGGMRVDCTAPQKSVQVLC